MALLEVSGISKTFGGTEVLRDISFQLEQGEALAIIGSSGSGKTTLLRCLNFLERPDTGVIQVGGEVMWDASDPAAQNEEEIRKNGCALAWYSKTSTSFHSTQPCKM